ncbi:MAG TPA: zinc-binding alcohol dehydrogenase [Chthoniobacteraceae bacterium]|nr:zinc-binding alcohol dehydrogenase [Chthoniobacteraceae bacterium]
MSTGTENIVFNRLFDPGTHWDWWVKYPFYPGYAVVGAVESLGRGTKGLKVGDRVACRSAHGSHSNQAVADCFPIPDNVPSEEAVWFAFAKIAFHGVSVAQLRLGESTLIIGAGPIGQMAVRWAAAAGAESILALDPIERRLAMARAGGATAVLSQPLHEARQAILDCNSAVLPRVVIDSTGNSKVFQQALGFVRNFGTMVVLGDTGQPGLQALTPDVITRGLHIVGAHDAHNDATWNNSTISRLFFSLASRSRFPLDQLSTHRFSPAECGDAYLLVNRDRANTMGVLFDWR